MSHLLSQIHPALGRSPLLRELSPRKAEVVGRLAAVVPVAPGTTLARQGAKRDCRALIVEGEISVERDGIVVGRLGAGDFFRVSGAATLVAASDAVLLAATGEVFETLAHVIPCLQARVQESEDARRGETRSQRENASVGG